MHRNDAFAQQVPHPPCTGCGSGAPLRCCSCTHSAHVTAKKCQWRFSDQHLIAGPLVRVCSCATVSSCVSREAQESLQPVASGYRAVRQLKYVRAQIQGLGFGQLSRWRSLAAQRVAAVQVCAGGAEEGVPPDGCPLCRAAQQPARRPRLGCRAVRSPGPRERSLCVEMKRSSQYNEC